MIEIGYYVALENTTDEVQELNGNPYEGNVASLLSLGYELQNDTPETYPDLVNTIPFSVKINGATYTAEAFGGTHPPIPTRPRP